MSILIQGGIELNGVTPVFVKVPEIHRLSAIHFRAVSTQLYGTIDLGEITHLSGFHLSSTDDRDKGPTVFFDVYEFEERKKEPKPVPAKTPASKPTSN